MALNGMDALREAEQAIAKARAILESQDSSDAVLDEMTAGPLGQGWAMLAMAYSRYAEAWAKLEQLEQ